MLLRLLVVSARRTKETIAATAATAGVYAIPGVLRAALNTELLIIRFPD
jgi:hypothetical protein